MKFAIVSDLHANASAFATVVADARRLGAEDFVCLGDVVGYGPLPRQTLAAVRELCSVCVAGNHDDAVSGRRGAGDFIDLAGESVARHRRELPQSDISFLASLPYSAEFSTALAVHGGPAAPETFPYIEDVASAGANFDATGAEIVFVGHTHVPAVFRRTAGRTTEENPRSFRMLPGERYIVNPGSVGYPREKDGRCLSSYVLFDDEARTVEFRFLPFSVASVMQRGTGGGGPRAKTAACAAAALLLCGGALWAVRCAVHGRSRARAAVPPAAETSSPEAASAVKRATVTISGRGSVIVPNLKLKRGDPPARLRIKYKDAAGNTLDEKSVIVEQSFAREVRPPAAAAAAVSAELAVLPVGDGGAKPTVLDFSPVARRRETAASR